MHNWGRLYDELTGVLRCDVDGKELGLADAESLLLQPDKAVRRQAWESIQSLERP